MSTLSTWSVTERSFDDGNGGQLRAIPPATDVCRGLLAIRASTASSVAAPHGRVMVPAVNSLMRKKTLASPTTVGLALVLVGCSARVSAHVGVSQVSSDQMVTKVGAALPESDAS